MKEDDVNEPIWTPRIHRGPLTRALVVENPHPSLDELLAQEGFSVERLHAAPSSEDALIEALNRGQHQLLFKRSRVEVTRRVIEEVPSLQAVMLCCIGDDSVDKQACADAGVMVMNDPISNGRSVVELVLGEMLCMGRRVFEAVDETNRHQFKKTDKARYELKGKTVSIIGLGNIGKQVAQVCEALGMRIVFFDNREVAREVGETLGWKAASSLREAFALAHVVSLHLSANDVKGNSNEGLITRELLMAQGEQIDVPGPKLFLNAARGVIHNAEDLIAAVEANVIDYAFVDVFPEEPHHERNAWDNPYAAHPRIYATPHIGAATQEAQPRIARHMARTAKLFNLCGCVRDCVFSPRFPIEIQGMDEMRYVLAVVHSDRRGTKKAIGEAIYEAGLSNLSSTHRDFARLGAAYDLNVLDGALDDAQIRAMIERAVQATGDPRAIRSVRMIGG
jgi:D-3-phosphoglycerate dehydrogenase